MRNHKSKKYFVKDESLHGVDNDMFNYADISKILNDIVETNAPPFNVAVIGKWGLGKSSLINLVTDKYKKDSKNYLVQEINAWKYEKESLRKVFLKQLWQGLSDKKVHSFEVIRQEISDITKDDLNENHPAAKKIDYRFLKYFVIFVFCSIVAMLVYKIVQFSTLGEAIFTASFWAELFLSYCKNIGTVLFIPLILAVLNMLINDYKEKQIKKFELSFPIETTDDYEIFLESKIRDHLQKYKDLKIITIIDDLDRLSIDKIVEALDAIKAFVGFDRCIFIVPFDDEIIKRALNKRRAQQFNDQDDVVESELILDKLFQFKVYLPPILDFDIQDYAINLAKQEIPDFLNDYCSADIMDKVIRRILIHPGVSTPRQVKKLLNAFINNYMVAKEREASGKVERALLTNEKGTMQIAKISVLQADFNSFYDLLFKDMGCIDKILKIHREEPMPQYFPPYLKNYFNQISVEGSDSLSYKLKPEFEPLINFLIITEKYTVPSIAPYLYLAQDAISIQTGDEQQRRMTHALRSGNYKTVQAILRDEPATAEVIMRNITSDTLDAPSTLASAINAFTEVLEKYRTPLAQTIIFRTLELSSIEQKELYTVSAENVFSVYELGESQDFNNEFLRRYLTKMTDPELFDKKTFLAALLVIVSHYPKLHFDMQQCVIDVTKYAINCTFNTASDLFENVDATDMQSVHVLWGLNWYNLLCSDMHADEDFSDETIRQLKQTFDSLKGYSKVDELCAPLVQLCEYDQFITVLADILETQIDGVTFKSKLPKNIATQFADYAVAQDYKEHGSDAYRILNDLTFEIKDNNSRSMDDFMANTLQGMASEKCLVYCGKQKWLDKLPNTINKFLTNIYADSSLDKLLATILPYFTESMKESFFQNLGNKVHYRSGYSYDREVSIVELVTNNGMYNVELNNLFRNYVVPQMISYWSYEEYYQFIRRIVATLNANLLQESVDLYIRSIHDYIYSSDPKKALLLIALVPNMMSSDVFKRIFSRIITGNQASVFDQAVDIIIDNDKLRPKTQTDVDNYYQFLYENLSTSLYPDKVLSVISTAFSRISSLPVVVKNAKSNNKCADEAIVNFLTVFLQRHEIEVIVQDILKIYADDPRDETIISALKGIEIHKIDDILSGLYDKLHESTPVNGIVAVATLGSYFLNLQNAKKLLLLCLSSALKKINMVNESKAIMRIMNDHKEELTVCKSEIVEVLHEGFSSTDSKEIKEYILSVVSSFKVRSTFRKKLKGDDLEFYKKWSN